MTVVPVPVIVPTLLFPERTPSTVQFTVVSDAFWTAAMNCCVPFVSMLDVLGLMLTATAGAGITLCAGVALELVAVLAEVENDPDPQAKKHRVRKLVSNRGRCCFIPGNGDPSSGRWPIAEITELQTEPNRSQKGPNGVLRCRCSGQSCRIALKRLENRLVDCAKLWLVVDSSANAR